MASDKTGDNIINIDPNALIDLLRRKDEAIENLTKQVENLTAEVAKLTAERFPLPEDDRMSDEEGFQIGSNEIDQGTKRKNNRENTKVDKKPRKDPFPPLRPKNNISLTNRYEVLTVEGEELHVPVSQDTQESTEELEEVPKRPKNTPKIQISATVDVKVLIEILNRNKIELRCPIRSGKNFHAVYTKGPDDYRRLVKVLKAANIEYCFWQLAEEKELKVVVKGVPKSVPIEEVEQSLKDQGFAFSKVNRMKNRNGDLPMVLVNAPKSDEGKKMYDIKNIGYVAVQAEAKRRQSDARQCYRCQRFGHVAYRCNFAEKCVKCAGNHASRDCQLKRTDKPKCANCEGAHIASSWDCRQHPKNIREKREEERQEAEKIKREKTIRATVQEGVSFAEKTNTSLKETIAKVLEEILPTILSKYGL